MRRISATMVILCLVGSALFAANPVWWTNSETMIIDGNPNVSHAVSENYAPANIGQLKNVAKQAKKYLDPILPSTPQKALVESKLAEFAPDNGISLTAAEIAEDYSPLNIGQLKAVSKPFYDWINSAHGQVLPYPWTETTSDDANYAPANIGQLKKVFSFEQMIFFPGSFPDDIDGDEIPDVWELANGLNPNDPSDGDADSDEDGLSNFQEYNLGTDPNSSWSDEDDMPDGVDPNPTIANPGVPWYFYVTVPTLEAVWAAGDNDYSEVDFTKIKLQWQSSTLAGGYIIERTVEAENWQSVATVSAATNEYPIQNLLAKQYYKFRITAYRDVNGGRVFSECPSVVYYEVPVLLSFDSKKPYITKSKAGTKEFVTPSPTPGETPSPPKFYLTKVDKAHSEAAGTVNWETIDYTNTVVIDPANHKTQRDDSYIMGGHSATTQPYSSTIYGATSELHYTYIAPTKESATTSTTSWSIAHTEKQITYTNTFHSEHTDSPTTYWSIGAYVPSSSSGPLFWNGVSWAGANSEAPSINWSGVATYDFIPVGTGTHAIDTDVSQEASGYWSGTQTINGVTTSVGGSSWSADGYAFGVAYRSGTPIKTPTKITYAQGQNGDAYSTTDTQELSNEYLTDAFITDVLHDLPDYPDSWLKDWVGWINSVPSNALNWGDPRQAWRHLSDDESRFEVKKIKYKMKASPSVPYTLRWNEIFVPDDDPATEDIDESEDIEFGGQHEWNLAGSLNISQEFEMADSVSKSEKGTYGFHHIDISFEAVNDNEPISSNSYPSTWTAAGYPVDWTPMPGRGKRIFPDAKSPTDQVTTRDLVDVKVYVGMPNKKVYLKVIDVDDPTSDKYDLDPVTQQHIVDPNDQGGEKGGDNTGNAAKFTSSNSDSVDCVTDASGYAKVGEDYPRLKVSMRPGDNYRIAVAYKKSDLGTLQVTNKGGSGYVPASDESVVDFKGDVSPMLTVWRKLNLEIDSMDKIPKPKGGPDHVRFSNAHWITSDTLSVAWSIDASQILDFYKNGYVEKSGAKTRINSSTLITHGIFDSEVRLSFSTPPGVPQNIVNGDSFDIYDDDGRFLDLLGMGSPLPMTNRHIQIANSLQEVFSAVYVEIIDADQYNYNKIVPFKLNSLDDATLIMPGTDYATFSSNRDLPLSTNTFWTWFVVIGYQGPQASDGDPDTEQIAPGTSLAETSNGIKAPKLSIIHYEDIRDRVFYSKADIQFDSESERINERANLNGRFFGTIAHELGHNHSIGNNHFENSPNLEENGLMREGGLSLLDPEAYFKAYTVLRLRNNNLW